jgi:hypothetical protein
MQRYRILNNVEIESKTGRFALVEGCFDVQAKSDGLWLITPKINGKQQCSINLTNPNASHMLLTLWRQLLRNQALDSDSKKPPQVSSIVIRQ